MDTRRRLTRSAPSSFTLFAQAAGSDQTSPYASARALGHSAGCLSNTSMATTGGWGISPSKLKKGMPDAPPTVTVEPRVPPSAGVAPSVTVFTRPDHFSLTSLITMQDLLLLHPIEFRRA